MAIVEPGESATVACLNRRENIEVNLLFAAGLSGFPYSVGFSIRFDFSCSAWICVKDFEDPRVDLNESYISSTERNSIRFDFKTKNFESISAENRSSIYAHFGRTHCARNAEIFFGFGEPKRSSVRIMNNQHI